MSKGVARNFGLSVLYVMERAAHFCCYNSIKGAMPNLKLLSHVSFRWRCPSSRGLVVLLNPGRQPFSILEVEG